LFGKNILPVALHPFATHTAKSWPISTWIQFADLLRKKNIPFFWIGQGTGIPEEKNNFINQTDLRQLAALLAHARVLITGDSGPMHIATAVNTPVLAMFGPTCQEWGFFPSGPSDRVIQLDMPCRPCSLHGSASCPRKNACITQISPDNIFRELHNFL
jgi:ADP-heptose:LPS heptosyltransferase